MKKSAISPVPISRSRIGSYINYRGQYWRVEQVIFNYKRETLYTLVDLDNPYKLIAIPSYCKVDGIIY